ncbi:hypothetical protein AAEY27_11600 [Kosakonia sp. BYX6]|uniref:Uncharacterized protein n=1 Tax=Kosakonia calanthes TaxID=3139408 RepID=A0ABZ3B031_9ENTR
MYAYDTKKRPGASLSPQGTSEGAEADQNKSGYIYAPFVAPDLVEHSLGINVIRHTKGKQLYPVIVEDQSLAEMEKLRSEKEKELKDTIDRLSDALQLMEEELKGMPGWRSEDLRNQFNPKIYDKTIQGITDFSRDLSVLQRVCFIGHSNGQLLKSLSPQTTKLYIIGHGGPGVDILAADQDMQRGMVTAEQIAKALSVGGLDPHYRDIRVRACYSADAQHPENFSMAELEKSAKPFGGILGFGKNKKKPFAQSLKEELVKNGFPDISVSGYHGAGVTYSKEDWHARRLRNKGDVQASSVRRKF